MELITPQWPLPAHVHAVITTRKGGVSQPPFDQFNMGDHVGDEPSAVSTNRAQLGEAVNGVMYWLNQTHSTDVVNLDELTETPLGPFEGDASVTTQPGRACVVMTADCLPVLFCDDEGKQVAAAHAGWRGLLNGILENTLNTFRYPDRVTAYLGPAIGPKAFEVGDEVRQAFVERDDAVSQYFEPSENPSKWLCNLYGIAKDRLTGLSVKAVFGGDDCTFSDVERFYSYRRDGQTGRMASVIWIDP